MCTIVHFSTCIPLEYCEGLYMCIMGVLYCFVYVFYGSIVQFGISVLYMKLAHY